MDFNKTCWCETSGIGFVWLQRGQKGGQFVVSRLALLQNQLARILCAMLC